MTPESTLRALCERHQVPYSVGERLLPLVRSALEAPEPTRERLLALVERNLQQRAPDADREVLLAVARVLHDWSPSDPLLDLGGNQGRLSFPNPEPS
jgi:hypothetical protein